MMVDLVKQALIADRSPAMLFHPNRFSTVDRSDNATILNISLYIRFICAICN
jgi:hypothetical protein